MKKVFYATLFMAFTSAPVSVLAQLSGPFVSGTMSFQGFVTDLSGVPITAIENVTTTLYKNDVAGHTQVHSNVEIVNGIFSVRLTALDSVRFNQPIEIGIKIGADPEISPRTILTSVPFALAVRGFHALPAGDGSNTGINVIGGASHNIVAAGVVGATIGGGGGSEVFSSRPDSVLGDWGTVAGGGLNAAGLYGSVGGGFSNRAVGFSATVGGGRNNAASGDFAIVAGGNVNVAGGLAATIGGGNGNVAGGEYSAIGGGSGNAAGGQYSTVPGGLLNRAEGSFSLAAGRRAKADHGGTFVWADSTPNADFVSTDPDQFLIRATGGVGIGTNAPNTQLSVVGDADFADNVAIGKIAASAPLDIQGGNFDLNATEGDIRVGSASNRLKIGVATGGAGAGRATIRAQGTNVPELRLGAEDADVVIINKGDGLIPTVTNTYTLGKSGNEWSEVWATDGTINSSDRRLKQDIRAVPYGLREILQLLPVTYRWKSHPENGDKIGLIAQDVDSVIPEVVRHGETPDEMLGINYAELVPVLIRAIQEQQETIEAQSRRLAVLEARMTN